MVFGCRLAVSKCLCSMLSRVTCCRMLGPDEGVEDLLRHVHAAQPPSQALLAGLLFLQQLALAAHVAAVALGEDVLPEGLRWAKQYLGRSEPVCQNSGCGGLSPHPARVRRSSPAGDFHEA